MSLVTIGMSHKTASLDVREKLAVDKNESQKILKKLLEKTFKKAF